jgi:nucleotide-binding universal stress UspA family protein
MPNYMMTMQDALSDFRQARQRAVVRQIITKLTGEKNKLLSFDEVRQLLKTQGSLQRGLQEIPLEAIIGSVNRYEDFTRDFLPLRNVNPRRWASIDILTDGVAGLPPIEVYKIGEAYFVIDGNHRVSVARKYGAITIQAYVHEVPSRVAISPNDSMEEVFLKSEYSQFLEKTRLDILRPGSDLMMTSAGQFYILEEHIKVHQYYMGLDLKRDIPYQEAVTHWYDTVYLPVVKIIRKQGLQHDFPGRTEADLYLWIAEHRAEIELSLGGTIRTDLAASDLAQSQGARLSNLTSRLGGKVADVLLPDTLESGPPPGEWRLSREKSLEECCLFSDILVPVSGDETSWAALEQAILVAGLEQSRLHGLKVVASRSAKNLPENLAIQEKFNDQCKQANITGKLSLSAGPVARKIVEKSRWTDLVIINLSHPPAPQQLSKLGSGFRELVLRCPRPILAVPETTSMLKSALLAYDGSPKAEEALFVATYLAGKWQIPLTILSVFELESKVQSVQQHAIDYLSNHGVTATFIHSKGNIAAAILTTAQENQCDFIIMGGYGEPPLVNLLLDTIVDQVMRISHLPMLLCR